MSILLKLNDINKFYKHGEKKIYILKNINLSIEYGDFISITGSSGSGKSTLLSILAGLDRPSSGQYFFSGKNISAFSPAQLAMLRCTKFGFIFQQYHLITHLNVEENIILPSLYAGSIYSSSRPKAKFLLDELGIASKIFSMPNQLSGGQQQRVSIARAIINDSDILFADEPTGALDSSSGLKVLDILLKLNKEGRTIILVTHDMSIAQRANRVIELHDGVIRNDYRLSHFRSKIFCDNKNFLLPEKKIIPFLLLSCKEALRSILSHSLRSFLTILAVAIGIVSIISMVGLGIGAQNKLIEDIGALGPNALEVYAGTSIGSTNYHKVNPFTPQDIQYLSTIHGIKCISPKIIISGTLRYHNFDRISYMYGVGTSFFDILNIKLKKGRFFMESDIINANNVVVIDYNTCNTIFNDMDSALGKYLIFNNVPFQIIGILDMQNCIFLPSETLNIFIPYSAFTTRITRKQEFDSILIKIAEGFSSHDMEIIIIERIKDIHKGFDYYTINTDDIGQIIEKTGYTTTLVLSGIAFISLIVAGIGVMNIMLVSSVERTKEIGIRMAVGARPIHIIIQFILESLMICFTGGIVGIFIFIIIYNIYNMFSTQFNIVFSPILFIIAILASIFLGVSFGFIPAYRASQQNPFQLLFKE